MDHLSFKLGTADLSEIQCSQLAMKRHNDATMAKTFNAWTYCYCGYKAM